MIGETKDGGPAFPSVLYSHERSENWSTDGMSLRDWLAGQALIGLASDGDTLQQISREGGDPAVTTSRTAYVIADAMLAERSKP